jgi:Holliday junction resolvase RusA-like endonuclease
LISFTIPGPPVGKQRPKFSRRGSFVRTYTPEKTVSYESLVCLSFAAAYPAFVPLEGPVRFTVRAYCQIPNSTPKRLLARMESEIVPCPKKPDKTNIEKIIEDALNGIAYKDDSQITDSGPFLKRYSPRPRVEVEIQALEEGRSV